MTRRIARRRRAVNDRDAAFDWYDARRSGLGSLFPSRVLERLRQISENPTAFPIVERNARWARVKRFPYAIFYETFPEYIAVVAVYHLHLSPEEWRQQEA